MPDTLHILLAAAVFAGAFTLGSAQSKPSAAQLVTEAFHQLPSAPAHGGLCLPASFNMDDRRDPIAVLIENN